MLTCNGCIHRSTYGKPDSACAGCLAYDRYWSYTDTDSHKPTDDISKEMTMLTKYALNSIYGVRKENNMKFEVCESCRHCSKATDGCMYRISCKMSPTTIFPTMFRPKVDYMRYSHVDINTKPPMPKIKNVIFNDPATIVFWEDDTKTVVKAQGDDAFDPEKGLAMAIAKKALGNKGDYCEVFKKWLPKEEEQVYSRFADFDDKMKEAADAIKRLGERLKAADKKHEH